MGVKQALGAGLFLRAVPRAAYHARAMDVPQTLTIGSFKLESPVLLAPLAGYTDLPFRMAVRSFGGLGLAFTEMLNPSSLLHNGGKIIKQLLSTEPGDRPVSYQIYGNDAALLAQGAQWLVERGAELIDINMGCPQKKISGRGAGAGLLKTPELAVKIAEDVVHAVKVPVTVKIRLGWDDPAVGLTLAKEFERVGVAAVTVHGRTRLQRFAGQADWDGIRAIVEAVRTIPVIANGDITSPAVAREVFAKTGCAGVMLGRQPLKEPWIIRDITRDLRGEPPLPPPSAAERLAVMLEQYDRSVPIYSERVALLLFRKWTFRYLRSLGIDKTVIVPILHIEDPVEWRKQVTDVMLSAPA